MASQRELCDTLKVLLFAAFKLETLIVLMTVHCLSTYPDVHHNSLLAGFPLDRDLQPAACDCFKLSSNDSVSIPGPAVVLLFT